ncbi:hypothetical protein CPB86DRAFT_792213 [Serendipita vermifera]|nr:hypothetical protein CPB86DRAFT_792213 [Serendipita vermifera]
MSLQTPHQGKKNSDSDHTSRLDQAAGTTLPSSNFDSWTLYNEKATPLDHDMLKQWDNELSTLLIFVRIDIGFWSNITSSQRRPDCFPLS